MKTLKFLDGLLIVVSVLASLMIGGISALAIERAVPEFRKFVDLDMGRIKSLPEDCNCTAAIADALQAVTKKSPTELASKGVAGVWFPQGPSWGINAPTIVRESSYTTLDTYEDKRGVLGVQGVSEGAKTTWGFVLPAGIPRDETEILRYVLKTNIGGILYIWYLPTADKISIVGGNGNRWEWPK